MVVFYAFFNSCYSPKYALTDVLLNPDKKLVHLDKTFLLVKNNFPFNAVKFNEKVDNEVNASNDFLNVLVKNVSGIDDYIPQYANQAIHFTGDDMGGDEAMMTVLLYIIIGILAFVFAITTSNTIRKEANVIGTLRASGYTRGELIRHYMTAPVFVTFIGAIIGNIIG